MDTDSSEFTLDDIKEILRNKLNNVNYEIESFATKSSRKNVGLLGKHLYLKVKLTNTNVTNYYTFFAKFFPKHEGPAKFAKEIGAFKKEIFAYKLFDNIINDGVLLLKDCVPRSYYTKEDRVIVLDDLSVDYVNVNTKITDKETMEVIIKNLAKLHASSLIYEENQTKLLKRKFRLIDGNETDFDESFYNESNKYGVKASIKGVLKEIDLFDHTLLLPNGNDFKEIVEKLCLKIYDHVKPSIKYRNVLSHGDLWSNNFLLKFDDFNKPIECKFVDFQLMRYVPPSQDLLSLIYLTTNRDFRKRYMYELIGFYYATLEKYMKLYGYNLNTLIDFKQFMDSCENEKLFALILTATYFQLILIDGDFLENFFADKELYNKVFMEDRSILITSYIDKSDEYKERLRESIQDFRDYCESLGY